MSYGGPILVNTATDGSHPDSVTGTEIGNKRAVDVNMVGGEVNISSTSSSDGGYSTETGDFTATPTAASKNVVIAGLPFTLTDCSVIAGSARVIDSSGNVKDIPDTNVTISGSTITFGDKADNFAAGDTVCMSIAGPDKAYDQASDADRNSEIDPISQHFVTESFVLTNVPNATPDETTLIDMDGFSSLMVQVEKTGGADTFVWTMESSVEGSASTNDFIDSTQFGFTSATITSAATYTADGILFSNNRFNPRGHKVKITTAGAADDADFNIFIKKFY